ncbi:MAG: hypothetical protein EON47_22740, partial [Acetobacteraceae bacterium]
MAVPHSDWLLVSLSTLPRLWLGSACIAVVAATVLVLWRYWRLPQGGSLMLLRALGGLWLLGFLLEPALLRRTTTPQKTRLAIILDRSKSMQLPASATRSRIEVARSLLKEAAPVLQRLSERFVLEWHDLDGPLVGAALQQPPEGKQTDLLAALQRVAQTAAPQPLGAVLLLSDGADHGELQATENQSAAPLQRRLQALGVPVNTVAVAAANAVPDAAITKLDVAAFAYVHNSLALEASLRLQGLP